jgi:hypothetical protein
MYSIQPISFLYACLFMKSTNRHWLSTIPPLSTKQSLLRWTHWTQHCYCNVHVYVVICFCDSMWSFRIYAVFLKSFLCLYICMLLPLTDLTPPHLVPLEILPTAARMIGIIYMFFVFWNTIRTCIPLRLHRIYKIKTWISN